MTNRKHTYLIVTLTILVCAIALRAIHIDADTPSGLSWSAGLYVDEGYKTLSPRNLILYGKTHWHEADTYPGWMKISPITQWSIYAAFKSFGVNISSARIVPIIYFALFILLYVFFMYHRYGLKLFSLGLILLATDITLFTFSRAALFEIPISFFLYALILPLSIFNKKKKTSILTIVWLLIGGLIIAYTVKLSALIYVFPVLASASIFFITNNNKITRKQIVLFASVLLATIFVVLGSSYNFWSQRLDLSPLTYVYSIIENPLLLTSPLILIAGTLCAAHAIAYQSSHYFNNLYRLSLISIVVSAPFILSLFSYSPLRYYVPFIPAYILLIIEWFHTTPRNTTHKSTSYALGGFGLFLLGLAIMYIFIALELHEQTQMRHLIIIGSGTTVMLWSLRRILFSNRTALLAVAGLVALSILHNTYFIGSFISSPSYQANTMRAQLRKVVNDDEIISGGWAPFLALGTPIRAIYANTDFNTPGALKKIKPNYFILSNTPTALESFKRLKNDKSIIIGSPIDLGMYNEAAVQIYPLSYDESGS